MASRRRSAVREEPLAIVGPLLVVSPHFDDIPLSCEAFIGRPAAMTVLHVCSGVPSPPVSTDWDRDSGFADSDEATAGRRAEEHAAFTGTPHDFLDVGLLDGQYAGERTAAERAEVTEAVARWVETVGAPCTVAVPVGAGRRDDDALVPLVRLRNLVTKGLLSSRHPDHLLARDAALAAVRSRPEVTVVLYEELPYRLTTRGDGQANEVARSIGANARLVRSDVAIDRARKAQRLQAYRTQLPLLFPRHAVVDASSLAAFLPPTERYWRITPG